MSACTVVSDNDDDDSDSGMYLCNFVYVYRIWI